MPRDDGGVSLEFKPGGRYSVARHYDRAKNGVVECRHPRDYLFVGRYRGTHCVHYVFRSCSAGWAESFTDLQILMRDVEIRPIRGRGK